MALDAIMKAERIFYDRLDNADGTIVEMVIWRVPSPVAASHHSLKYRLFYGRPGQRLVLYDNERGKGDHRHIGDRQASYRFTTVEALVADFLADIERVRGQS
jgi:hypothetical protein